MFERREVEPVVELDVATVTHERGALHDLFDRGATQRQNPVQVADGAAETYGCPGATSRWRIGPVLPLSAGASRPLILVR